MLRRILGLYKYFKTLSLFSFLKKLYLSVKSSSVFIIDVLLVKADDGVAIMHSIVENCYFSVINVCISELGLPSKGEIGREIPNSSVDQIHKNRSV
jgi:hypothetical protein